MGAVVLLLLTICNLRHACTEVPLADDRVTAGPARLQLERSGSSCRAMRAASEHVQVAIVRAMPPLLPAQVVQLSLGMMVGVASALWVELCWRNGVDGLDHRVTQSHDAAQRVTLSLRACTFCFFLSLCSEEPNLTVRAQTIISNSQVESCRYLACASPQRQLELWLHGGPPVRRHRRRCKAKNSIRSVAMLHLKCYKNSVNLRRPTYL